MKKNEECHAEHQEILEALDFRGLMVTWIQVTANELESQDLTSLEITRVIAEKILEPKVAERLLAHDRHGPKLIQVAGKIVAGHAVPTGDLPASMRAAALILAALPLGGPTATLLVADMMKAEASEQVAGV